MGLVSYLVAWTYGPETWELQQDLQAWGHQDYIDIFNA